MSENIQELMTVETPDPFENEMLRGERALLIGVDSAQAGFQDIETSMAELDLLAQTAGLTVCGELLQAREAPERRSYLGSGKLEEMREAVLAGDVDVVIANDELSPVQMKALEAAAGVKVIDRTMLILDIFARRAVSAEGKIQVELAQLQYRKSRLRGMGEVLSRTGGGIGTRGPGEKKLETDRRAIDREIVELRHRLEQVTKTARLTSARRKKTGQIIVALVGYTNAGKSTLFNALTDSAVTEDDALFVTLDSTVRKSAESAYLYSDTVGFIDKLPHHLVNAFRSTLEEARQADVLLHVMDASDPNAAARRAVVEHVLKDIGCLKENDQMLLPVYNKIDLLSADDRQAVINKAAREGGIAVCAKALEREDFEKHIAEALRSRTRQVSYRLPYDKSGLLDKIYACAENVEADYTDDAIVVRCTVRPEKEAGALKAYRTEADD